jgi:hypothetical protein
LESNPFGATMDQQVRQRPTILGINNFSLRKIGMVEQLPIFIDYFGGNMSLQNQNIYLDFYIAHNQKNS